MVEIHSTQTTTEPHATNLFPKNVEEDDTLIIEIPPRTNNGMGGNQKLQNGRKHASSPAPAMTAKELENEKYLTVKEAAIYLKIPENTLRSKLIAGRKIPFIKRGNSIRFNRTKLDDWMDSQEVEPITIN